MTGVLDPRRKPSAPTRRAALIVIGVALSVCAGGLLWVLARPNSPPSAVRAYEATAFLDSVGVNVHFSYVDTAYGRQPEVLARLRELGVHHIRDGAPLGSAPLEHGLRAAARVGIRSTLIAGRLDDRARSGVASAVASVGQRDIAALEAPNEPDIQGDPAWERKLRSFLPELRSEARLRFDRPPPILGPSIVDDANLSRVTGLGDAVDEVNLHPYSGGRPPEATIAERIAKVTGLPGAAGKPLVASEAGFHNATGATTGQPPVSEQAAAVYLPRLVLEYFRVGIRRTFIYELLDQLSDPEHEDPEQNFGLLRADLSRKPGFIALRDLLSAVRRSPGEPVGARPSVQVDSGDVPVRQLLLARDDGSAVLALWRPERVWDVAARREIQTVPRRAVVRFAAAAHDVTVSRPSAGRAATRRFDRSREITLDLGADAALVSFR